MPSILCCCQHGLLTQCLLAQSVGLGFNVLQDVITNCCSSFARHRLAAAGGNRLANRLLGAVGLQQALHWYWWPDKLLLQLPLGQHNM